MERRRFALSLVPTALAGQCADLSIVIHKSKRQMIVVRNGEPYKTYAVALGREPVGPKREQGDGKTPEGRYTISARNPNSKFHLALRVSYPSAEDTANATKRGVSPGGDIMIHGLPNGQGHVGAAHRNTDWTEGCIAVTNEEIEEIWKLIPNGTPVEIKP